MSRTSSRRALPKFSMVRFPPTPLPLLNAHAHHRIPRLSLDPRRRFSTRGVSGLGRKVSFGCFGARAGVHVCVWSRGILLMGQTRDRRGRVVFEVRSNTFPCFIRPLMVMVPIEPTHVRTRRTSSLIFRSSEQSISVSKRRYSQQ